MSAGIEQKIKHFSSGQVRWSSQRFLLSLFWRSKKPKRFCMQTAYRREHGTI